VYVLFGRDDRALPRAYIGETDAIRSRLEQHLANKEFWNVAYFFVSKDENLNKAHVRYLEARLIDLAKTAKRCELDNGNAGMPPSLSEADIAEAEGFLDEMLQCFPLLGVDVFETPAMIPQEIRKLRISAKGLQAWGHESGEGFVVLKDSQTPFNEVVSCPSQIKILRATLKENGVLAPLDGHLAFTQDYAFSSPSTAAGVVLARSANGRVEWVDMQGRSLKAIQEAEAL